MSNKGTSVFHILLFFTLMCIIVHLNLHVEMSDNVCLFMHHISLCMHNKFMFTVVTSVNFLCDVAYYDQCHSFE